MYRLTRNRKTGSFIRLEVPETERDDSPAFDPENRGLHDSENQELLGYMEESGPFPFNTEAAMYLRLHPDYIEVNGLLSDYLLLVDKARGLKRDGYDAFARREESDQADKRRERRERWTLRIAFLALIAAAFEESITKAVSKYLLGE